VVGKYNKKQLAFLSTFAKIQGKNEVKSAKIQGKKGANFAKIQGKTLAQLLYFCTLET